MEIVIILIVVGILGYVFYQTLPDPKFQKAKSLYDSGNFDEAIKILDTIFSKHSEAPFKLAECKLMQGQKAKDSNEALKYFNDVVEIKKRLPNNTDKKRYEPVEAKAQFEIALIHFKSAIAVANVEIKIKNLKDNLLLIDLATKTGIENEFSELINKHSFELARLYFAQGLQCEKENQFSDAIKKYKTAKDYSTKASIHEIRYNSTVRIAICKLKENPRDVEFVSFEEYNKADRKYAHDFFYRYVIYLLKKESYSDAETILKNHLNLPSRTVEQLKEILKTKQIRQAVRKVEEINTSIEQLYEKSFPVDEVKALYENLNERINEIKPVIPEIADRLQAIKPSLFNRLLSHYISVEQFGNGINLIQKFPKFWECPELMKNLGICCYGFAAKGNISDKNYQIVISNWLTSVFSDTVILNSLEATSWDDNYTFTLSDSIGSKYQQHSYLPDNANYDEITDTNISIGATQRELLQQFETVLHKTISEPSLSKSVHDFYSEEKVAVERIVSVITNDILFAAPHFAKSYGLNEEIIRELDNDYAEYSNEESLEAGIPYLNSYAETYVREYATARETVSAMVSAIQNEKLIDLRAVTSERKRAIIEKYDTINDSLEDTLFYAFNSKIEENVDNEDLIPLMEECIRFARENSKLRAQCSTYIHDYCDFNWRKKSAVRLLELMIKSIRHNPNNYRAAKSLTILINNNLMDIVNEGTNSTSKIYALIDEVKNIRSQVLKDALKELITLRNKVLISIGAEVARTIAIGYNLNSNGMKLKKVLDTMQTLGGGY